MSKRDAIFIYNHEQLPYEFSKEHPFSPLRQVLTVDLLRSLGAISDDDMIHSKSASDEQICLFHDHSFMEAVKHAGTESLGNGSLEKYGLGTEDTPVFKDMHLAASNLVGGTIRAAHEVMEGRVLHAAHLGGGLHHGFRGKASGFCIYNDTAIAIRYLRERYDVKVLYIDTDAHHGDGVQWAFYDDPNVMTLSIHETGRYLFPGTGAITEKGNGKGYGFSLNIPVDAFTEDESFIHCYETAVREACRFFKPDIIVSQNGADAHHFDPLTHLSTSMETFYAVPRLAHELAHEYCGGRWVAVGGGGYDWWRVVPKAWSLVWLEMTNQTSKATGNLPEDWLAKWQDRAHPTKLINTWKEPSSMMPNIPRKLEIEEKNNNTLEKALYYIRENQ
ncbi:acetoin utilization protein AcuC [Geomicrobium sp. JCM 19055]|uniref:acetoin utilization protein AcuC n=1 Tax=Geomicrobium sp. JCM 19055 TaxID=1460649 RepID=UPI00045ECF27|nr:acetoin utilization protein AcuC [Geomicrobium sp. JCM 19055]GAJ99420.1 NAD-independent protein deacetylase AcuC [Geomicrobium sp. JCM 19055]